MKVEPAEKLLPAVARTTISEVRGAVEDALSALELTSLGVLDSGPL